ncbi:hypothetical protein Q8F55_007768 [Vanrija albida]|uniref:FAS1 domain-containing protein n=1 Tax=Vanrija albida TaxID=181172 RepID=A0ABR3PUL6_9TREE
MRGAVTLLALAGAAVAEQLAFQNPAHAASTEVHEQSDSLVSLVSASTQHGTFVRLLQRSKSIPLLWHIGNATLFAPTDAAWAKWAEEHKPKGDDEVRVAGWLGAGGLDEWLVAPDAADLALDQQVSAASEEEGKRLRLEADNQSWALRQHILYHVLNYTLWPSDWAPQNSSNVTIETTLLYPLDSAPDSPIPPPGSPWKWPETGLLGTHGQRLRVSRPGTAEGGPRGRIGADHEGNGSAEVWDGAGWERTGNKTESLKDKGKDKDKPPVGVRWARNGLVVGLESVLEPPPSIKEVIRKHPSLSYLSRLLQTADPLPPPLPPWLDRAPHVTLFAASNSAFEATFDAIERGYLEGAFGAEGLSRVVSPGFVLGVNGDNVGWSDTWKKNKPLNVTVASGSLNITSPSQGAIFVNGTAAETVDIFASNGVIHVLPQLLLPEGFELLNSAEKVLLSRNATRFVSLLRSANLSSTYVGVPGKKTKKEFTILAPTDEAIEALEWWINVAVPGGDHSMQSLAAAGLRSEPDDGTKPPPPEETSPLAALLKYHIVPGQVTPKDLEDDMLLETELKTAELGGARQRIHVEVSDRRKPGTDGHIEDGEISIGGALVIGSPVKSGKSVIYFISSLLSPPLDVLQTAVSDLQLSTYIAAVYAAGLERSVKANEGTTYFIPRNKAFARLGLAMKYLLLPEAREELRRTLRYHSIEKLVYSTEVEDGKTVLETQEGGNIVLEKSVNKTLTLSSPYKWAGHDSGASLPANGELNPATMVARDSLTETGVIHVVDNVVLPADVDITAAKLIRGSKQRVMADLMVKAGLSWVLEGREPTEVELERVGLGGFVRAGPHAWRADNSTEDLALPSYTVLVPTDTAFGRLNLTHYLNNNDALLELLKLHIIPSSLDVALPKGSIEKGPKQPPKDGYPLALEDDVVYPTLLTPTARYGQLAFRAFGADGFIVGIHNARGGSNNDNAAHTGDSGRASVRWKHSRGDDGGDGGDGGIRAFKDDKESGDIDNGPLWRGGMSLGGGVILVDAVLIPFNPGWFERWRWLVLTVALTTAAVTLMGVSFWWWWSTNRKNEGYEPIDAECEREQEEAARSWRRTNRNSIAVPANGTEPDDD